jgi:2-polyprenyl-3-methyl-5-hydroxy-6-metoxy-1,4-benzoquinol methylase
MTAVPLPAETYDTTRVPGIYEPWSRDLIARAKVWREDKVLDVATGTGIVACRVAASGATVTGLDPDPLRLMRARVRATEEGVSVKWLEGRADALPFRGPTFDLVTCQHGLQYIADPVLALRELKRVIHPGGRIVLATWAARDEQAAPDVLATDDDDPERMFSLGDASALTKLLTDATFFAVNVETIVRQLRLPEPTPTTALIAVGRVKA